MSLRYTNRDRRFLTFLDSIRTSKLSLVRPGRVKRLSLFFEGLDDSFSPLNKPAERHSLISNIMNFDPMTINYSFPATPNAMNLNYFNIPLLTPSFRELAVPAFGEPVVPPFGGLGGTFPARTLSVSPEGLANE